MTHSEAILKLGEAIALVLDSTNQDRGDDFRKQCKNSAIKILIEIVESRPFDYDPIIIKGSDIK